MTTTQNLEMDLDAGMFRDGKRQLLVAFVHHRCGVTMG